MALLNLKIKSIKETTFEKGLNMIYCRWKNLLLYQRFLKSRNAAPVNELLASSKSRLISFRAKHFVTSRYEQSFVKGVEIVLCLICSGFNCVQTCCSWELKKLRKLKHFVFSSHTALYRFLLCSIWCILRIFPPKTFIFLWCCRKCFSLCCAMKRNF